MCVTEKWDRVGLAQTTRSHPDVRQEKRKGGKVTPCLVSSVRLSWRSHRDAREGRRARGARPVAAGSPPRRQRGWLRMPAISDGVRAAAQRSRNRGVHPFPSEAQGC